jgi:hypothetical protein
MAARTSRRKRVAATRTKLLGRPVRRGVKMPIGKGWRLVSPSQQRAFKAALLGTFYLGGSRLAVFRVLPLPD